MMIDRVSGVNPLQNVSKTQHVARTEKTGVAEDTVSVSDEAKRLAEEMMLSEIAAETPDIREDLVADVKERIKNPNYLNETVLNSTADKFLTSLGI